MKLGIIGATGAVGQEMLKILEERKVPIEQLRLFASERSVDTVVCFQNQLLSIERLHEQCFEGLDAVLGAVSAELSQKVFPWIKKAGALYIDNSSAFRLHEYVPLVVAQINPEDMEKHHGIIANPNCVTMIGLMACAPIHRISPIRNMTVTSYQAVSGAGKKGMDELMDQMKCLVEQKECQSHVFDVQIAANVIPCIGQIHESGFTSEELKFEAEARKILHEDSLEVLCTCARVPVVRSHSLSMVIECESELCLDEVKQAYQSFPGVQISDEIITPLQSSNQDDVFVSRLRHDLNDPKKLVLWCTSDQIRKGAALNAVQLLEIWMKRKQLMN